MLLYSTTGGHFATGARVTLSIMPDGTNIGGTTSNLVSTLDNRFGSGAWQPAFLAASAWWENYANINVAWVGDDGSAFGSGNYQQGDPNKGDIRIGGFAQASNSMAFTILPPPANGASDSGDVFMNTNLTWSMGGGYDLETVAIHEIGHALGLGHSADSYASMYANYNGVKQSPSTDDIAGIRAVWGPRQEDGLAQGWSNFTFANAANINPFMNSSNQITLAYQSVAKSSESYNFKVTTPANSSSSLSIVVQSSSLSLLSPKVQLFDANTNGLIQTSAATNAYGAAIGMTYGSATPNTTYYIRVFGTNGGQTGTGAYALLVNMGSAGMSLVNPPNTQVAVQASQGGGGLSQILGGDNGTTVIFPTFRTQAEFLMTPGSIDPKVYRVSSFKQHGVAAPASPATAAGDVTASPLTISTVTSISAQDKGASANVPAPIRGQRPAGPGSASLRPAQALDDYSWLDD